MDFSKPGPAAEERPGRSRPGGSNVRPGAAYSALISRLASQALPARLRPFAYRAFARAVGANLSEAELELAAYPSLGDFFARKLRHGVRTVDATKGAIVSPCDGVIAARGTVTDGALVQAKGRNYSLAELVANDVLAARLMGGEYVTIYLSPRDYHRVHAPVGGQLLGYDYLPGSLWPVNPRVAARRDALLARNERVVIELNSGAAGHVAVVMVAAAGVGNITLTHGPDSVTFRAASERRRVELHQARVECGDELGAFRLGSTVVLVFEPDHAQLDPLEAGQAVSFGTAIGRSA